MKLRLAAILFGLAMAARAETPKIEGVWRLAEWKVISESGEESEFCKGANGILMYEASGFVSTSINCPKKAATAPEPADSYGRKFFYAGTYYEKCGAIYKGVTNASFEPLIGQQVYRKIERVTDYELVLTGPFGPKDSLWIRWTRN